MCGNLWDIVVSDSYYFCYGWCLLVIILVFVEVMFIELWSIFLRNGGEVGFSCDEWESVDSGL